MTRLSLLVLVMVCFGGSLSVPSGARGEDRPANSAPNPADPWAVTEACTTVLDKYASCRADKTMKRATAAWFAAAEARRKGAKAAMHAVLRSWTKRNGRRQQCAAWANRPELPGHLGPESKLAKLAGQRSTTCAAFAHELDADGWVPRALESK